MRLTISSYIYLFLHVQYFIFNSYCPKQSTTMREYIIAENKSLYHWHSRLASLFKLLTFSENNWKIFL